MNFSIINAAAEHIQQIASIEQKEFSFPMTGEMLSHLLEDSTVIFLSAVSGGNVLGYVSMKYVDNEGFFNNIAVLPEFRCMGIGDSLINKLFDESRAKNVDILSLEVRENNRSAIKLYEKNGFEIAGIIKNYYTNPKDNAIIMRKILL